ncbi:MAG: hypothetical protein ABIR33_06965 [Pyrinomonadaceae bacterium]
MTQKSKRPPSVWIAQIILGIYATGFVLILVWSLYGAITQGGRDVQSLFVGVVTNLTFIAIFISGVLGMANRKPWGRWLGVAGLSMLLVGAAITQTSRQLSGRDEASSIFSFGLIYSILVVIGIAFLVYKIAAGDAAEEFFNGKPVKLPDPIREPPPPPTFER